MLKLRSHTDLATGPPVGGGGGMPQRIVTISVPASVLRITGAGQSGHRPDPLLHNGIS